MATRRSAASQALAPKLQLSPTELKRGIARLDERLAELRAFDITKISGSSSPELNALSVAIQGTLERYFGENTSAYKRFESAASLNWFPGYVPRSGFSAHECQEGVQRNLDKSIALLDGAKRALQENLEDAADEQPEVQQLVPSVNPALSRRVFVVHGHDGEARELVARFLGKIGFEPVILHEQANRGGTVIEKIEANRDVGFAVVLLTPDDVGRSIKEEELKPRARQNVLLELGYFIGHLGREKVCALKRGDLDIPSDFTGVVWEKMDDSGGWKQSLGRELEAAGHEVDWNKVMRS